MTPERELWIAVLACAVRDALGHVQGGVTTDASVDVRRARTYFRDGGTDFRTVCWLADREPDVVQARVVAAIDRREEKERDMLKQLRAVGMAA
jgi:hypothetical protein